jgi:hypothetical protein
MKGVVETVEGLVYYGDTFEIHMTMYTDPNRLRLARNAARYLGKKDIDNVRRPLSIIRQGHVPEIFRGEHVEFEFVDVDKTVYDHIITYTTRDMRVAGGNRALTSDDYTMPSDKMKESYWVDEFIKKSMDNYQALLELGETPQVARAAMPVAAKMNTFVYQFNFLTLGQSFFAQRIWDKGAQGNTVKVIQGMFELCYHVDRELWDTFYEYMGTPLLQWKEVKRKLGKKNVTVHEVLNDLHQSALSGEGDPYENVIDYLVRKYGDIKTMW